MKKVKISCNTLLELEKKINEYFYSDGYIITDDLQVYNFKMDKFIDYHYSVRQSQKGRWQLVYNSKVKVVNK